MSTDASKAERQALASSLRRAGSRDFLLNILGVAVPTVVAVLVLPSLSERLGDSRLGMLSLIWAVVGYFGLFDLGMSRALARRAAEAGDDCELQAICRALVRKVFRWLSIATVAVAVAATAVVAAGVGLEPRAEGGIDPGELRLAVIFALAALPAVILSGLPRGILEGRQDFVTANALRICIASWSFLAPLIASYWTPTMGPSVALIAIGRWAGLILYWRYAERALPAARGAIEADVAAAGLLREGGWLSVSSVVGPVRVSLDRFVIAWWVSVAAVAYYAVPQEIVLRLLALPTALALAVFPLIARVKPQNAPSVWRAQHETTLAISLPLCLGLSLFSHEALSLWMGADFASESALAASIFAIGMLANSAAQVPFGMLQAAGRSEVTGKLHLIEFVPFMALSIAGTHYGGIAGAAAAWTLRMIADCGLLWSAVTRLGLARDVRRELTSVAHCILLVASSVGVGVLLEPGSWRLAVSAPWLLAGLVASAIFARGALSHVRADVETRERG